MDLDVSNRLELYRVPRDGSSSPVKLSPPLAVNGNVGAFTLSPDGLRVLYLAAVDALPGDELFSVPLAGGTPVQISSVGQSVGTIGNELACRISPDGALLVFTADRQLYLAPTNGSAAPIQLTPTNGPLVDASHGLVLSDSWVACVAEETPLVSELFSAPFDGSQALAKLSPSLHPGPIQRDVRAFRVLPDGSRALYLVNDDPAVLDDLSLYTVTLTGSPVSTRIHSPVRLDRFSLSDPRGFEITPDGACVVFVEPDATTGFEQLFVARTDGSEVPMLLHAGQVDGYEITPDGMSVLFDSAPDNYIVPLDGSAGALAFGPGVEDVFQASPDGQWIVWLRNFQEIWSRRADGSSSALKISGTMPSFGSILRTNEGDYFRVSSDGTRVVYLSDALVDGRAELFVATIDGSSPPVRLNAPLPTGGSVAGDYRISPDSTGVAYRADQETLDRVELFLTPFGGTSTKLSGTTVPGGDVAAQFRFSADGSKVVFVADRLTNAVHELFATPVDASTAPVKISGSMATGGGVVTSFYHAFFQIEADGEHAVYAADQVRDGVVELFRAPLSGTGPSRRLHQGFGSQADLLLDLGLTAHLPPAFFLTGTGHVLFIADANRDESFELFRVPLDGPAFAERRNGSLVPSGDVVISDLSPDPPFHFPVETPTGTVYLADQQADEVFELFLTLRSPTPTTSTGPSITGTVVRQL
jgi:Tol biopolymer transport system component